MKSVTGWAETTLAFPGCHQGEWPLTLVRVVLHLELQLFPLQLQEVHLDLQVLLLCLQRILKLDEFLLEEVVSGKSAGTTRGHRQLPLQRLLVM